MARIHALAFAVFASAISAQAADFSCSPKKFCGGMQNCAEAVFFLRQCGHTRRDGDNDGIPCEKLCGKTLEVMESRLKAQGGIPGVAQGTALPAVFSCTPRKNCGQVASCAEARFQLETCGHTALDGNKDGVPCNALCR